MGTLKLRYSEKVDADGMVDYYLPISKFKEFNPSILGLGDVANESEYYEALAAIFDLEGFTSFCNQIDPHLVIPEYLNAFLNWLFQTISELFLQREDKTKAVVWCHFPFFAKFLGDGVLFLWDTRNMQAGCIGNIVMSLQDVCREYEETFLPKIKKLVSKPPIKLRCGIARGQILSIGNGNDFVGPCINVAARLQKIGQFSFAFSKRGFNLERYFDDSVH
jgi:class 3 adenylate cyclase